MDIVDLKHLEILLGKMQQEIGMNRFLICPCYWQDGCYIGVYNEYGKIEKQAIGLDIEDALMKIINTQTK